MLFFPDIKFLDESAKVGKYSFGLATAALTIFSLLNEVTLKEANAAGRKTLTEAGRRYLIWFVLLAVVTAIVTALGDIADDQKKVEAQAKLDGSFKGLDQSVGDKLKALNNQVDLAKGIIAAGVEASTSSIEATTNIANQKIADSQAMLLKNVKEANGGVTALHAAVGETQRKLGEEVIDTGELQQEANRQVRDFHYQVAFPGRSASLTSVFAQTAGGVPSTFIPVAEACGAVKGTDGHLDPTNTCDVAYQADRSYDRMHAFADALYAGAELNVTVTLETKRFELFLLIKDCGARRVGAIVQPCLTAGMREPATRKKVPLLIDGVPGFAGAMVTYNRSYDSQLKDGDYRAPTLISRGYRWRFARSQSAT